MLKWKIWEKNIYIYYMPNDSKRAIYWFHYIISNTFNKFSMQNKAGRIISHLASETNLSRVIGEAIFWLERLRVHLMIRITQFTQISSIVSRGTNIERNTVVFLKAPRFTVTFSLYLEALDNETLQRKIFQIRLKFQNTTITCKDSRILIFFTLPYFHEK